MNKNASTFPSLPSSKVKKILRLQQKRKEREAQQCFIIEGARSIKQALQSHQGEASLLYLVFYDEPLSHKKIQQFRTSQKTFKKLSTLKSPQNVLGVFKIPPHTFDTWINEEVKKNISLVIFLDYIQDPSNIGAIIRTASWFNADGVLASKKTGDIFNGKSVRASAGGIFSIPVFNLKHRSIDIVKRFKTHGYKIFVASQKGNPNIKEFVTYPKVILIMGNEGSGISQDLLTIADKLIQLKGNNLHIESLNVAAAASILIAYRQLILGPTSL